MFSELNIEDPIARLPRASAVRRVAGKCCCPPMACLFAARGLDQRFEDALHVLTFGKRFGMPLHTDAEGQAFYLDRDQTIRGDTNDLSPLPTFSTPWWCRLLTNVSPRLGCLPAWSRQQC